MTDLEVWKEFATTTLGVTADTLIENNYTARQVSEFAATVADLMILEYRKRQVSLNTAN
jgi:hypothetical protein